MAYTGRAADKQVYTSKGPTTANEFNFPSWVRLDSQTASSSSSIEFTSFVDSNFKTYVVVLEEVDLSGGSNLEMEISDDNGSTWQTSNYQSGNTFIAYNSATWINQNITDAFQIFTGAINNTNGQIYLYNFNSSANVSIYGFFRPQNYNGFEMTYGRQTTLTNVDAFRFVPIGVNTIDAGKFTLFGLYTG
jgi:hypothetical protein